MEPKLNTEEIQVIIDQCNNLLEQIEQYPPQADIENLINDLIKKSNTLLEGSNQGSYYQLIAYTFLAQAEHKLSGTKTSVAEKKTLNESSYESFEKVTQAALSSEENFICYQFLPWSMEYLSKYMEDIDKESDDYEFLMTEMSKIMTGVMVSTEKFREECDKANEDLLEHKIIFEGLRGIDNKKDFDAIVKNSISSLKEIRKTFFLYGETEKYEQAQDFLEKFENSKFSEEMVIPDFLEQLEAGESTPEKMYYYIDQSNQQQGPLTLEQVKEADIFTNTMIWYEGLKEWKPAEEIEEFTWLAPPPLPED